MNEEPIVNEEKTVSPDQEETPGETSSSKKGFLSKLSILKIPVLVVVVSLLAVGTAFAVTKVARGNSKVAKAESSTPKEEPAKTEVGKFINLDVFTVNLAGGQNYLQAAISLEIDSSNTELEEEIKERKPQINDSIITILSAKTMDEISDRGGRSKLKIEVKKAVDSLLSYGKIERVYFTTFIMQ